MISMDTPCMDFESQMRIPFQFLQIFARVQRGDFSGFGMIAEGILYIAGILLMCWLFTQPVLLGILIVIGIVIAYASYRNKKEIE